MLILKHFCKIIFPLKISCRELNAPMCAGLLWKKVPIFLLFFWEVVLALHKKVSIRVYATSRKIKMLERLGGTRFLQWFKFPALFPMFFRQKKGMISIHCKSRASPCSASMSFSYYFPSRAFLASSIHLEFTNLLFSEIKTRAFILATYRILSTVRTYLWIFGSVFESK